MTGTPTNSVLDVEGPYSRHRQTQRNPSQVISDLSRYRESAREHERVNDLLSLIPSVGRSVLDAGARDGHVSRLLKDRFQMVVALDLAPPALDDPDITSVQGDITALPFDDDCFDAVLCAEVLEHIPSNLVERACNELSRVARDVVVIGVPYRQDLRCGRTTCRMCGRENPPWGHVNSFDERKLVALFPHMVAGRMSYVGETSAYTNELSARLLRYAGNPYGTYDQDESCVHCGSALRPPSSRTVLQRCATRAAIAVMTLQQRLGPSHPNWIHTRFDKSIRRERDVTVDRS